MKKVHPSQEISPSWRQNMELLTVDPGRLTGWAAWSSTGKLLSCGLAREPYDTIPKGAPLLVIEKPHEGQGRATKGDLMMLARRMQMAISAARADEVIEVFPVQWKGSIPKVFKAPDGKKYYPALSQIKAKMTLLDQGVFMHCMLSGKVAESYRNNVLDAVGIGIDWLHRSGVRKARVA